MPAAEDAGAGARLLRSDPARLDRRYDELRQRLNAAANPSSAAFNDMLAALRPLPR
jgi:hypothetical protein